ncbi:hypothetical protein GCM10007913_40640 [Devosia yakushimensis]|uniref:Uncharacterized protein n=1 Tax=Devosia yakushimensis TaxID=470028 RepID=A0ABQ5ULA2_9HYPH|nr:hypothetical protein GCM10007913_40640 [Devosia yakushimensis]
MRSEYVKEGGVHMGGSGFGAAADRRVGSLVVTGRLTPGHVGRGSAISRYPRRPEVPSLETKAIMTRNEDAQFRTLCGTLVLPRPA